MMCKWNPMKRGGKGGGGRFNDLLNEKAKRIKDNVIMLRS